MARYWATGAEQRTGLDFPNDRLGNVKSFGWWGCRNGPRDVSWRFLKSPERAEKVARWKDVQELEQGLVPMTGAKCTKESLGYFMCESFEHDNPLHACQVRYLA